MVLCLGVFIASSCQNETDRVTSFGVTAGLDTTRATIGDVLRFRVRVQNAGDRHIQFPDLTVQNPYVDVGNRTELKGDDTGELGVEFEVTFWDTGAFTLPSYPVNVMASAGDTVDSTVWTDSLQVSVATVVDHPSPQLRDLKRPVPIPLRIPVRSILSVASIVVLAGLLVWLWRRRVPFDAGGEDIAVPSESPYQIARKKITALRRQDPDSPENIRQSYSDLSYVLREFLEFQYFVRALEMTTSDIETSRMLLPLEETDLSDLLDFLKRADLVKFAGIQPDRKAYAADLDLVEEFIEKSRQEWLIPEPNGVSTELS